LLFWDKALFSFPFWYITGSALESLEALQSIIIATLFRHVSIVRALGQVDLHTLQCNHSENKKNIPAPVIILLRYWNFGANNVEPVGARATINILSYKLGAKMA
jgi:hypothetical protein